MNELVTTSPSASLVVGAEFNAALAKATVETRYAMAVKFPRNMEQVRQDLVKECNRPAFANNPSAYYRKPIGKGVEGLGIRFVEVAFRCMKNIFIESNMLYEDQEKEIHRVTVTELESNVSYPLDVRVSKTVERSRPADDGTYISMRKNSRGEWVYTVPANDDDLLNKRGAAISKAIRTLGLRIIPGELQDEAEEIIKRIRMNEAAQDPNATRNNILDSFAKLGVLADDLAEYLGHPVATCTPKELVDLRNLYGAIRDGEATWASAMENGVEQRSPKGEKPEAKPEEKAFPEERFKKEFPTWKKAMERGQKPDNIINMAESTGLKLTDAQKSEIRAAAPAMEAQ